MSSSTQQRQRHGVKKNLVEGIGGVLVGAALVLLVRAALRQPAPKTGAAGHDEAMIPAHSGDSA